MSEPIWKRRVFCGETIIAADPDTFVVLGQGFARDRSHVWFGTLPIDGVDPAKLVVRGGDYASDGTRVVHRKRPVAADAATFEVLGRVGHQSIARDRDHVFVDENLAEGVDARSFELLGAGLAADRRGLMVVRFGIERLDGDRASLIVLDDHYARDRERVWHDGQLVPGVAASTFVVLGHGYGSDGSRVVRAGMVLDVPAPALVIVDEDYTLVRGAVHFDQAIDGADATTFRSLGHKFARDARCVYFDGAPIAGADVGSFEVFGSAWARDRTRVWHRVYEWNDYCDGEHLVATGADATTFEVIDDVYARDASRVWRGSRAVDADAATFRARGGGWYSDEAAVWYADQRIAGIDPRTVTIADSFAIAALPDVALDLVGDGYAADALRVMYAGWTVDGPSPDGARSLGGGYLVDSRAAWFYVLATPSRKMIDFSASGGRLDGADPRSLRRDRGFAIDRANVFCGMQRSDADAASFRAVDARHGVDRDAAWFDATRIPADPARFRPLGGMYMHGHAYTLADFGGIADAWSTDGETLFLCGRPAWDSRARYLTDATAARLRAIDAGRLRVLDRWWATDGDAVLLLGGGFVIDEIEALTFLALDDGYARDRGSIWYLGHRVRARADTFRLLGDGYATDGETTFYRGDPIATRGRFDGLGGGWARDEIGILCAGRRVDADPDTFVVLGSGADDGRVHVPDHPTDERDAMWCVEGRIAVGRDRSSLWWPQATPVPASAVVIAHDYAITQTAVFHAGQPVEADVATFVEIGDGYARDAFRTFFRGRVTR